MPQTVYTLGVWRVKSGNETAFIEAWKDLGAIFLWLPHPPPAGQGTLIQSLTDASLFYSFGPWMSLADIQAMREDKTAQDGIARLRTLCVEATPGSFQVVATV